MAESASQRRLLEGVAQVFGLEATPERIEVYDNSHTRGTNSVGGMIVAGPEGFMKSAYRKFNIRNVEDGERDERVGELEAGDDYAMMRQVLTRRFARALKEDPERGSGNWPGPDGRASCRERGSTDEWVSGAAARVKKK